MGKRKPTLNFIDLFAGAGGLSCGLEMAGWCCLMGVENDPVAVRTFRRNHPRAEVFDDSIQNLKPRMLEELLGGRQVHLVAGGPPCQGFSTVGRGDPKDRRNSLFLEFVRIVEVTRPCFVLLENVTGLVARKNESTLQAIFGHFEKLGYRLDVRVMSAENHGVPERRRRTVILGSRINPAVRFPEATHNTRRGRRWRPAVTVGEVLGDLRAPDGSIYNHCTERARPPSQETQMRLPYIPEGKGIRYRQDEREYLPPELHLGVDWDNMSEGRFRQARYQRLDRSRPSPTILTQRIMYYHPIENRHLTPREAARIQSFPNHFVFEGSVTSQWRQIGNAVPPLLGKAVGATLKKLYREAGEGRVPETPETGKGLDKIHQVRSGAFVYPAQEAPA